MSTTFQQRTAMVSDKIDSAGNYHPFYGYTVISMVTDRDGVAQQWEKYIREAPTLGAYVTPLPPSSYHATVCDLFTQRSVPERYTPKSGLVPSCYWDSCKKLLQQDLSDAQEQCEKFKGEIVFHKTHRLGFSQGSAPAPALLIEGTVSDEKSVFELAESTKLSLHGVGKVIKKFHITLGYAYKEIDETNLDKIMEELKGLESLVPDSIPLDKPNVCFFESMKEFTPVKTLH